MVSNRLFVSAVVLAAGASRRMRRPKQLLLVSGQPMLARVVDCVLSAGVAEVIVVLGFAAEEIALVLAGRPVAVVLNPGWQEGLASSIRAGLAAVSPDAQAVLFIPADLPMLTASSVRAVIERFQATGKAIVMPTCGGRRGNPVLFARSLFAELAALSGDQGGRVLFAQHEADLEMVEVDDEGVLVDVDTLADYRGVLGSQEG